MKNMCFLVVALSAVFGAWASQPTQQNIVQLAEHTADLSILVSALVAGDLADTLSSAGKFTVFAPTDTAFKALPAGTLDTLMKPENKAQLVDILKYHVLPEEVLSKQLQPFQAVNTVEGKPLHVTEFGGRVRVGSSLESKDLKNVIKADNLASNGVVHIIDGVLLPPSGASLPLCPRAIFNPGFCHPWELKDGGVACVHDLSPNAKITKPADVQCVPKKNGGAQYTCPSWVPKMCQPVYDGANTVELAAAPSTKNIVELAESVKDLSTLVAAVVAGDLADTLSSPGPFTVFAPTNEAFAALPAGTLAKLMKPENKKELVDILTYHVLPEKVLSKQLKPFQAVNTVEGKPLHVTEFGGRVRVGSSLESKDLKNVIKADNLASNGVVHIIDGVLLPPSGASLPLCPRAIFNPGFCHPWELKDGGVACVHDLSPNAKITKPADVQCVPKKNGGAQYTCPSWVPKMCQPVYDGANTVELAAAPSTKNIVELAESVKDLSTLVAAVVAGDLADTLSSPGPFTVFAPTNEAFAALPAGTLAKLMKPENKKELVDILTYHVLPEKVLSTDLQASQAVKTIEGKLVQVTKSHRHVRVGASLRDLKNVIAADNLASNGVVHIIDGVLLPGAAPAPAPPTPPKQQNIVQLAEHTTDLSILVSALVAGDLADTLSSAGPFTVFAPTDEAFKALPAGTLDTLMKPENKAKLVDILKYHVLPEEVLSTQLKPFQAVKTVEGKPLHVQEWGGKVRVGPSLLSRDLKNVIKADNVASNGVVHIIDGVLLPPSSADSGLSAAAAVIMV